MNPKIETGARRYAEARTDLADAVHALHQRIEQLKREALPTIQTLVKRVAAREAELRLHVEQSAADFASPRTVTLHGIKLGFRKGAGGIEWDDEAQVVERIHKLFPASEAGLLLKTTERPIKKALADLDVATLKRLGCRVEETGDIVVIRATDTDLDKTISTLLKTAAAGNAPEILTTD